MGTGSALGASGLNRSGFSSLPVCFPVPLALFLQSGFLRRQEPGPPASNSWLTSSYFVMREKRGLIFLVSSCKIPEDASGGLGSHVQPSATPCGSEDEILCLGQLSSLEQLLWPGMWSPIRTCQLSSHSDMLGLGVVEAVPQNNDVLLRKDKLVLRGRVSSTLQDDIVEVVLLQIRFGRTE